MDKVKNFMTTVSFLKIFLAMLGASFLTGFTVVGITKDFGFADAQLENSIQQESKERKESDSGIIQRITIGEKERDLLKTEWQEYKEENIEVITGMAKDIKYIAESVRELKSAKK